MSAEYSSPCAPSSSGPVLSFRGVCRRYHAPGGPVDALLDVSFDLFPGEFCAVTGPSGSGKSTLLHLAALLEAPTDGELFFEGVSTMGMSEQERAARRSGRVGLVFQRFHLLPHRTVLENVLFRFRYLPVPRREARRRAQGALEAVGLGPRARHRARLLSGGEMQRVAIARAIAWPPHLLVADEPTGNLDRATARTILELLRGLNRQGVTVLLATHNEALLQVGDRWLRLDQGRLATDTHY